MSILPDILQPGLAIVFCGTAAGAESARRGAYYAGPGNAFWPTLAEVGLTPHRLMPEAFRTVTQYGLGLTDLAKHVSGSDQALRKQDFDRAGLRARIERFQPRLLALTSKRTAQEFLQRPVTYGLAPERIGATALFVLPSPSGAARGHWDVGWWWELARYRR